MVNRLQAEGYPAEISNTAGTYLCNNIMYEGLAYAQQHKGFVLALFIFQHHLSWQSNMAKFPAGISEI